MTSNVRSAACAKIAEGVIESVGVSSSGGAPLLRPSFALIVEDFAPLAQALSQRLALNGCETLIANGVTAAEALLSSRRFDLALIDWDLPDGDGIDVAKRARECNDRAYVILMSGFLVSRRDRRLRGCVDAVICKPWQPGDLQRLLNAAQRRAVSRASRPRSRG